MDKYIIWNPSCSNLPVPRTKQHNLKQVTIHSLKGVVVIEDLLRHKAILELKGQKEELLLESLAKLNEKNPSKEALVSSKIDQTLHDLYHHTNVKVSKAARKLMHKWNNHISSKTNRPTLEVRYDLKTQHFRKTALKWLTNAFGGGDEDGKLCDLMEKEVFYLSGRLVNNCYKRTVRKIVLTLQHSDEKKNSLRNGEVSPTIFAAEHRR